MSENESKLRIARHLPTLREDVNVHGHVLKRLECLNTEGPQRMYTRFNRGYLWTFPI
jgi:hypothetical protein